MPAEALDIRALEVSYDGAPALTDIRLRVLSGEVVALLGPSGSGKSTLLHAVAGFHHPDGGEIWLNGRCVAGPDHAEPPERRDVAVVFQNYALWPHLSAVDTVAYPMRRRGLGRDQARREAMAILDRLDVAHLAARRPSELSGGEQQRVGLARALARDASTYLFDEPTAHLDTHVRSIFLEELVGRQRESGAAAVYATHDAEEALGVADRVALLDGGRVLQVGTPEQVYAEPVNLWAARLTGTASVISQDGVSLLVRPEWATLTGDRRAHVRDVRFRGPHSDYLLDTDLGRLLVRMSGPPRHARGDLVSWTLRHAWPLPSGPGGPDRASGTVAQLPSSAAGPE
jgi:iron(III) transport system ATP-binding protein